MSHLLAVCETYTHAAYEIGGTEDHTSTPIMPASNMNKSSMESWS